MPDLHPSSQINVASLCPNTFRVICGTDTPSACTFDFQNSEPVKSFFNLTTEVTTTRIHGRSSHFALLGTYGGTIVNWDIAENKGKYLFFMIKFKFLKLHQTRCMSTGACKEWNHFFSLGY